MKKFDLKGETVLVTGANGFIGAHLTAALLQAGADVHAMVRSGSSLDRLNHLQAAPHVVPVDLTDHAMVHDAVQKVRPKYVFHLAVSRQSADWAALLATNLDGALNLLRACGAVGVCRFITLGSSLDQIDPETGRAVNAYGASRAASGILLKHYAAAFQIPLAYLRTFYVYGPLQSRNKLIPTALRHAANGSPMPVSPCDSRRDYVHVSDVVSACLRATQIETPHQVSADIATGFKWSVQDVVSLVAELKGVDVKTCPQTRLTRAWDTNSDQSDTGRARALLGGWCAKTDLRAGVLDLIEQSGQTDAA